MKKLVAFSSIALFSCVGVAANQEIDDVVVKNSQLKQENEFLKSELNSLREQLKTKSNGLYDKSPENSKVVVSGQNQDEVLAVSTQTKSGTFLLSNDLRLSIGTKLWMNRWEKFFPDAYNIAVYQSESNDTALTPIPSVSLKYKDFFVTGSYFSETNYEWNSTAIAPAGIAMPAGAILNLDINGSRREYDVSVGYFIHPNIAVSAGYKDIYTTYDSSATLNGQQVYASHDKLSYQGAILGLLGVVPLGNGFGLYGNFAYGWMNANAYGYAGIRNRDASYILADGGVSYSYSLKSLTSLPISASAFAGYRYQVLEVENIGARGQKAEDYTKGFVTGLNLSF